MDCRRSVQLASLCLLPVSLCLAPGCTPTTQQVVNQPAPPPQVAVAAKKDSELPKKSPKPSTCVMSAEFFRVEANASQYTPEQRDELREKARIEYLQALRLEPTNAAAQLGLARLYFDMNNQDQSVAAYQKALKQDPKNVTLLYELGMVYARSKEWEPALVHLNSAFELDPANKQCATTYGHCLARAGRIDEALAVYRKVMGEALAHYNLARMLHHMNQDGLSRQQLDLALRADPQLSEARELLVQLSTTHTPGTVQP
jgi:tetratricopeptide (TPR) repeat protein